MNELYSGHMSFSLFIYKKIWTQVRWHCRNWAKVNGTNPATRQYYTVFKDALVADAF